MLTPLSHFAGLKEADPGQVEFTTPGTYNWVVPEGVRKVSVVCVGGGSHGGGGLGWISNHKVIPGETIAVQVGEWSPTPASIHGGDSYFRDPTTCLGQGGRLGTSSGGTGGTFVGDGGGNGGNSYYRGTSGIAGGGAGGYSGNGGNGHITGSGGGAGSGGAGGGGYTYVSSGAGGGGVGIYGEGPSGGNSGTSIGTAGRGGSGGQDAGGVPGGNYGGGAGRNSSSIGQPGGGAVRIIWGNRKNKREYPSTNTEDY